MDVALLLKTTRTVPHDALTLASLRTAASLLQSSQLVALPTETVYGLGANALSPSATAQIYAAKGRPSDNPLIVHIGSLAMLHQLLPGGAKSIPKVYEPLLKRFWPGPLSLLFPVSSPSLPPPQLALAPAVTAGLSSVAIRMPSHPLALALIQLANIPIAAPSANLSSRPSPTTAQHVMFDLGTGRGLGAILDGGDCDVGLESTVVDYVPPNLETDPEGFGEVRVLRVGGVSAEEIQDCLEQAGFKTPSDRKTQVWRKDFESPELESRPTTPGMKYKHYAPTNARVVLVRPVAANATDATATGGLPRSLLELIDHLVPPSSPSTNLTEERRQRTRRVGLLFSSPTLATLFPSSSLSLPLPLPLPTPSSPTSPPSTDPPPILLAHPLGPTPASAAQRLFAGLRHFDELPPEESQDADGNRGDGDEDRTGVDLILVECVEEVGVGMAVMERARKAAGGVREEEFRLS